jgi:hypothetical protein
LIGDSIGEWSKRSIQTKGRSSTAESEAEDLIETLSDEELTKFINILNIQEDNIDPSIQPSIDKLLEGKDFKQLLDLPFFERDFLNANKIRNVRFGFGIRPRTQFLSVAGNVNFILPWNVLLPGSGGDVSFDIDGQTYHTTKLNWNQAFNLHQDYTVL